MWGTEPRPPPLILYLAFSAADNYCPILDAVSLLKACLMKKPGLRPTLDEVLSHPFLAEYAPAQKAILVIQPSPAFSTRLEKDTLHRMKAAGVDIDQVIENVLAKKCDALAGWWALLIEKEERKERRRQKRKIESRRMSAASNLDPTLLPLNEESEDQMRRQNRKYNAFVSSMHEMLTAAPAVIILPERNLGRAPRGQTPPSPTPPPLVTKDGDYGPYLKPPQQDRQAMSSPDLHSEANGGKGRQNRKHALMTQLASIKHWFLDSAKRATSPNSKNNSNQNSASHNGNHLYQQFQNGLGSRSGNGARRNSRGNAAYNSSYRGTPPPKRNSLSPGPLTPHTSYRRPSGRGLGGRNSTSSSVSSIRSFHNKTHSKASSTSSASISSITLKSPRSPRGSIKVLPATPTSSTFPSHVRVVRSSSNGQGYNEAAVLTPGVAFAKRKKSPFKGPMLNQAALHAKRENAGVRIAQKRSRGNIIEEEDEDIEEVLEFMGPEESEDEDTLRGRHN